VNTNEMKEKLKPVLKRMPAYLKLAAALYKEPALSKRRKALLTAGMAYAISPVDLVPGFIPVMGQLDDIIVALAGIKNALGGLPPEVMADYEKRFSITAEDLESDIQAAKEVAFALFGKTFKYSVKGVYKAGRAGLKIIYKLIRKKP